MNLPFNLKSWIDEHRLLLKPPVGNKQIYIDNKDFIIMVVGGPNARKDYHVNDGEEFFYQVEGNIMLKIIEDGKNIDIPINEGDIFLLPSNVPHSPQRSANTVGLVIEKKREKVELDGFQWYCENCSTKLHEEFVNVTDIVKQLPLVMGKFYASLDKRTCNTCGSVMEPPKVAQ